MKKTVACVAILFISLLIIISSGDVSEPAAAQQRIPAPESALGFRIGEDRKLAKWEKFLAYYRQLDAASERVRLDELGQTTLRNPFVMLTISSPENLSRLDEIREIQLSLSDPRRIDGDERAVEDLIRRGKTIVVITCSIHSTEVGGTFTGTDLAYRLASDDSPGIRQILDNVVLFLAPSLNPDGTNIVAEWYEQTLGTPAEGTAPPKLYHHYTGHDNNRDWYAFTQVETQLTVDRILNVWRPQILHDIHQMGGSGARFFVPPYIDPWEPNVDPAITAGVTALGTSMAWEMTSQGKSGVVVNGIFDAWTPARAFAHYHAGLRILSETASARLATPVEVDFSALGGGQNYDARTATWNFPRPWRGGRWGMREIIDYQSAGAMALLRHAAVNREQHLRNFYAVSRRAIEAEGAPFAILLPEPEMPKSLADAFSRLNVGLRNVTGTPQQKHEQGEELVNTITNEPSSTQEVNYYYRTEGLDRLLAILKRGGVEVMRASGEFTADGRSYPAGTHIIYMKQPYGAFARMLLEPQRYPDLREYPGGPPKRPYDVTAHTLTLMMNVRAINVGRPFEVESRPEPAALVIQSRVRPNAGVRVGLYRNHFPSMDEGWTRWVFDQYRFPHVQLQDAEIRTGGLERSFDAIIIPDQAPEALISGLPGVPAQGGAGYPAEYAGGLGEAGIRALRDFVEAGGTLITLNRASLLAIDRFGLPVRDVLQGVSSKDFYCPGSILNLKVDGTNPLSFGIEKESIAWFENSPAFEVLDPSRAQVVASYDANENPLLSGWILGDRLIRGRAALVEARLGKGRVVLFGFRPQYRGQTLATLPILFNALLTSRSD